MEAVKVSSQQLARSSSRIQDGTISNNAARQVFEALWNGEGHRGGRHHRGQGLKQMNDSGALENHRRGDRRQPGQRGAVPRRRDKAFNALVGQVMKASKQRRIRSRSMSC